VKKRKPARRRRSRAHRPAAVASDTSPSPPPLPPALLPPAPGPAATQVEQRGLPIVAELDRVARGPGPSRVKLEGAIRILFAAYGASDPEFSGQLLAGWAQARHDKQFRLTLAWQREQIRLSIEDVLAEGVRNQDFRADLDAPAVAAVIVGAAEGCLLQTVTEGGTVPGDRVIRSLLVLAQPAGPGGRPTGQRGLSSIR